VTEKRQDRSGHPSINAVSVHEAARLLGTTVDAIRKRVQRDTIAYEKDADGRVWILLDTDRPRHDTGQDTTGQRQDALLSAKDETIGELRARIASLERSLEEERQARRRADTIMAQLTSRIPELPAASSPEAAESPVTASEEPGSGPPVPGGAERRSWWRRMFGG
jgi:hypothetical protein